MERDLLNRFDNVASLHMVSTHGNENNKRLESEKENGKKPAKTGLFFKKNTDNAGILHVVALLYGRFNTLLPYCMVGLIHQPSQSLYS